MLIGGAIMGVTAIGYFLDKSNNKNNSNNENFDEYNWKNVESFENNHLEATSIESPSNINAIHNAGNPPPDYELNTNIRPVEDFAINNMVPFFSGSGTNQDMRGTGVAESNWNSNDFNLGNLNETPNYTTLSNFTGTDYTYQHKREAPEMFSPLERRDRSSLPVDDPSGVRHLRDRYTTSILHKNEMTPFEQIKVGPGININAESPTSGMGYNAGLTTEVKPTNVGAYNKHQFVGRVAGTKYQASNLPTSMPGIGKTYNENTGKEEMYGVPSLKGGSGNRYYTLEDRPLGNQAPSEVHGQMHYSPVILPSATDKRTLTNVQFGSTINVSK